MGLKHGIRTVYLIATVRIPNGMRVYVLSDKNLIAQFYSVEELNHLLVRELYAAAAGRSADLFLVVSAVDVNVAVVRIACSSSVMSRFEAFQPEDTGGDEILGLLFGGEFLGVGGDLDAAFEDCPERGVLANFLGDSVESCGGAE